ncbi:unnamed protein product [Rhodiola kirilowii]
MCPLRFILVFFSAVLAGYFAWKSISADDHDDDLANFDDSSSQKQQETNFIQMMQNGFWIFVDMASGRYLWRNLNKRVVQVSCSPAAAASVHVQVKKTTAS